MQSEQTRLRGWIGKQRTSTDRIELASANALQATLGLDTAPLREGSPLPPLWHWLYFHSVARRSQLGRDGHPATGDFLPPVGNARRMWAGSSVSFLQPLTIGDRARKVSTVSDVNIKQGRSGRLVFVTVEHEISGSNGPAIFDRHDIVYLSGSTGASPPAGNPAPACAGYRLNYKTDPVLLFRYSALTLNSHRIHYDRDYATRVEGHPGLIVHGPLLATLMVHLAGRSSPGQQLKEFAFRGRRPVIDRQPFMVCGEPCGNQSMDLWIADNNGILSMTGRAEFDRAC